MSSSGDTAVRILAASAAIRPACLREGQVAEAAAAAERHILFLLGRLQISHIAYHSPRLLINAGATAQLARIMINNLSVQVTETE